MKAIDLLNKIANGEEVPKEIRYKDYEFTYNAYTGDYDRYMGTSLFTNLFSKERTNRFINDEVEVIEEDKKIEKLKTYKEIDDEEHYANILKVSKNGEYEINEALSVVVDKINEIIDKINKE